MQVLIFLLFQAVWFACVFAAAAAALAFYFARKGKTRPVVAAGVFYAIVTPVLLWLVRKR